MSAHTPGTWHAIQYQRSSAWRVTTTPLQASGDIANILAGLAARTDAEVRANAKLIAAAPKLLEAAQNALHYMRLHKYADKAWADDLEAAIQEATS